MTWVLDTEDDSRGKCFLFDFYNAHTHEHFTFVDHSLALDFVCGNRKRTYWAVNLEYDLNNLFRGHYGLLHFIYAGSRLITAEIPGERIRFLDTFNHWPFSVKNMGKRIGLPKLEMKHGGRIPTKKELGRCLKKEFI